MKNNRKIQIYCLLGASLIIGLFGAVCLFLGILGEYNDAMGYFNVDSLFAPVVYCCLAAGPVLGAVGAVIFKDLKAPDKALPGGILSKAAYFLAAVSILVGIVSDVMGKVDPMGAIQLNSADMVSLFMGVISVTVLVMLGLKKGEENAKAVVSLMGFATVFYCVSKVLTLYFDQSVAVNSPIKFICQAAYLSYMLVFTAEVGLSLGKGEMYSKYIFALCTAVAVGGTCSMASALTTVSGASCASFTGIDAITKVGLFLYAAVRLYLVMGMDLTAIDKKEKAAKKNKKAEKAEEVAPLEEFFEGDAEQTEE